MRGAVWNWIAVGVVVCGCHSRVLPPQPTIPPASPAIARILSQPSRIPKERLKGTFVFLKTVVGIQSPGKTYLPYSVGQQLESDKLIQFDWKENLLDVVSVDPLYEIETAAPRTRTLASFRARHTDIVLKKKTGEHHEETETEQRRDWPQREYVNVDLLQDFVDPVEDETSSSSLAAAPDWDPIREALNFTVERRLKDGTLWTVSYSFLRYHPSATYVQRPYSLEEQLRFGFFKTTAFSVNAFDQFTDSNRQEFINRWDTTRTLVFYFSESFPDHLKTTIRTVFQAWSAALKSAVGDSILVLRENTGQEKLGDLRYNVVTYDDSEHSAHGILGFSPSVNNPRTGEFLNANVILYGTVLKRALFQELFWEKTQHREAQPSSFASVESPAQNLRSAFQSDFNSRITRLNEDVLRQALRAAATPASFKNLEQRIFAGIFAHEFGHALGLTHNFLASADRPNFDQGHTSTSTMDYDFLQGHPWAIGKYDRAALQFGYNPDPTTREEQLKMNYLFCSDSDIYTSRNPLCLVYDTGSNLTELVATQLDRYFSNYEILNKRLDRMGFGRDLAAHERRVLASILPLRLVFDNADSVLKFSEKRDFPGLWNLARQRIEADPSTPEAALHPVVIELGETVSFDEAGPATQRRTLTRNLDLGKIESLIDDADTARTASLAALRKVVLSTKRPEQDSRNPINRRPEVLGVLRDKLLALTLLTAPSEHPLFKGKIVCPYTDRTVPPFLASLLSNTEEVFAPAESAAPYYRIRQYDVSLRLHALKLLKEEVAVLGRLPKALGLIQMQSLSADSSPPAVQTEFEKTHVVRDKFKDFYLTLMIEDFFTQGNTILGEAGFSFSDLSPFEQSRNEFQYAYESVAPGLLWVAPLQSGAGDLKTASGLLIRNNLNVAEDYLEAIALTKAQIRKAEKGGLLQEIVTISWLEQRQEMLDNYIEGERAFLRKMFSSTVPSP